MCQVSGPVYGYDKPGRPGYEYYKIMLLSCFYVVSALKAQGKKGAPLKLSKTFYTKPVAAKGTAKRTVPEASASTSAGKGATPSTSKTAAEVHTTSAGAGIYIFKCLLGQTLSSGIRSG